jgi:hypothetical protein
VTRTLQRREKNFTFKCLEHRSQEIIWIKEHKSLSNYGYYVTTNFVSPRIHMITKSTRLRRAVDCEHQECIHNFGGDTKRQLRRTGLWNNTEGVIRLDDPNAGRGKALFCSKTTIPALKPTNPPIQWVMEFFLGGKVASGIKLATLLHLRSGLRRVCSSYTS